MTNKSFQFKQFSVEQDKTAMKVGTDGVLLGAWVSLASKPLGILDIGAGTGLIALMMAQRSDAELIDAVELNDEAYEQTVENFENSDWGDRLFCYHASLQEYTDEIDEKYDLIVSNPPFYTSTHKELSKERAMARHSESLPTHELLSNVANLLSENGSCAFIIPYEATTSFIDLAEKNELFPCRITYVKGNHNSPVKRSLVQFSFFKKVIEESELVIEIARHHYTSAYIELVKDFYLKM
ncbi:MAG: tRNA (adenine-N(6)-)-methyltransferase [Lutibacter sp.]|nr:MAG: tRNA (adenine-N(6)-)-methyltransferase [Lutibacter sp.]